MPGAQNQDPNNNQPGAGENNNSNANDPAGSGGAGGDNGGDDSFGNDPAKLQAEIKRLRTENAKHRTKNKSLEDQMSSMSGSLGKIKQHLGIQDDVAPEQQVEELTAQNEALQMELSIAGLEHAHGISAEQKDYFRFLLSNKFNELKDGEEMTDEQIAEIVQTAKKVGGVQKNSTGLNSNGKDNQGGNPQVTVEQFRKMSLMEKSKLYTENQDLYLKLSAAR